jgi:hypothetical protein
MEAATPQEGAVPEAAAVVVLEPGPLPNLDIDLNGRLDALTDGVLVLRHLFGFTGNGFADGAVDPSGRRTDPIEITDYLTSIHSALDIDQNGIADALSDGILILRYAFGFEGGDLIGPLVLNGQRTDPGAIASYLHTMNPERETAPPLLFMQLEQDTGASNADGITFNPTITGFAIDINAIQSFRAGFDATPLSGYTDVLADLSSAGTFTLTPSRLAQVAGGTLSDGARTLHLEISDIRGNVTARDVFFTLDTRAPRTPTFTVHPAFDTGLVGDQQTTLSSITLLGMTEINAVVQLGVAGPTLIATPNTRFDVAGRVEFTGQPMGLGANTFTMTSTDLAGNTSSFTNTLMRVDSESFDVVSEWNAAHLRAIVLAQTPPPYAARNLAIVQTAVFDAINGIEQVYEPYRVAAQAPVGASSTAAAISAAHRALSALYPLQQATFDALLAASLTGVPNGQAKSDGIAWGQTVADEIVAWRSNDGSSTFVAYTPGTDPGEWQPTPNGFEPALLPQWPNVIPFAMTSGDQFRPGGPPALDSATYAAELNEVQAYGKTISAVRTAEQTEIARFWADGGRSFTPPGHWNQIAAQFTSQPGRTLLENARLFALLDMALADAGIVSWDAKYAFNLWRPITAIQQADLDGNAATTKDATWTSLLTTPPFPEYTSGHSTFSGAASTVLDSLVGPATGFSTMSLGLPGVYRTFTGFTQAANEAGQSRIYGGIHFQSANQDGLASGRSLGHYVLEQQLLPRSQALTASGAPTIAMEQATDTSVIGASLAYVQAKWIAGFLQTTAGQNTDDDIVVMLEA